MADIAFDVVVFTIPTVTGNIDITGSLGGRTPKAAMFIACGHQSALDPAETNDAEFMVGATDGTTQWATRTFANDNAASTQNGTNQRSDCCIAVPNQSLDSDLWRASFVSFAADKVTVNFGTANVANPRRMICILFAGTDLTVNVGLTGSLGAAATTTSITAPGFRPDVLFLAGDHSNAFNTTAASEYGIMFGIAVDDGTPSQRCVSWIEDSALGASAPGMAIHSNKGISQTTLNAATIAYEGAIAFTATGFDVTTDASAGTDTYGYLALDLGGEAFSLIGIDTPTAIGEVEYTTPGHPPRMVLFVGTAMEATDTAVMSALAGALAVGAVMTEGSLTGTSARARIQSGADPTNTGSFMPATGAPFFCPTDVSMATSVVSATYGGNLEDGFALDYTAVNAAVKKGFALTLGDGVPPPAVGGNQPVIFVSM